jgi:hypothetical protein
MRLRVPGSGRLRVILRKIRLGSGWRRFGGKSKLKIEN